MNFVCLSCGVAGGYFVLIRLFVEVVWGCFFGWVLIDCCSCWCVCCWYRFVVLCGVLCVLLFFCGGLDCDWLVFFWFVWCCVVLVGVWFVCNMDIFVCCILKFCLFCYFLFDDWYFGLLLGGYVVFEYVYFGVICCFDFVCCFLWLLVVLVDE